MGGMGCHVIFRVDASIPSPLKSRGYFVGAVKSYKTEAFGIGVLIVLR